MPKSLLLPSIDDTLVEVVFDGDEPKTLEFDMFELEMRFTDASDEAKDRGVHWDVVFRERFKEEFGFEVSKTQSHLMYSANLINIKELKKNLSKKSEPSENLGASE